MGAWRPRTHLMEWVSPLDQETCERVLSDKTRPWVKGFGAISQFVAAVEGNPALFFGDVEDGEVSLYRASQWRNYLCPSVLDATLHSDGDRTLLTGRVHFDVTMGLPAVLFFFGLFVIVPILTGTGLRVLGTALSGAVLYLLQSWSDRRFFIRSLRDVAGFEISQNGEVQ